MSIQKQNMQELEKIYVHTGDIHNTKAAEEVLPVVLDFLQVKSVLDVGCGTGTWLKVFSKKYGVTDFEGIDGAYIDYNQLVIDRVHFKEIDLRNPFDLQRKFDLVLCLEVAEHLPEQSADAIVASLCKHADTILFSAAIPGQGGQNHLNEQWPEYWQQKFLGHGFYFHDVIRPLIWNNEKVERWYKQNMFLVNKQKSNTGSNLSLVHPQQLIKTIHDNELYKKSLLDGKQGLRVSSAIFFNALFFKMKNLFR